MEDTAFPNSQFFIKALTSEGSRHLIHYNERKLPAGWMDGSLPSAALCYFGIFVSSEAPKCRMAGDQSVSLS